MKLFLTALSLSLVLVACLNKTDKEKKPISMTASSEVTPVTRDVSKSAKPQTSIHWLDSSRSLGKIAEGEMVKVSFRFENSGNHPLIIENVQASCGCTVADYPKNPIPQGGSGEIVATFNSNGRVGIQKKNLTVYANTEPQVHPLWFDLEVTQPKK